MLFSHSNRKKLIPLVLKGKEVSTNNAEPVTSPKDLNKTLHEFTTLENLEQEIPVICRDSYLGFLEWSAKSHKEKVKIMIKATELMQKYKEEFVQAHEEIGATSWFGQFNVDTAVAHIEEYASNLSQPDGVIPKSEHTDLALTIRTPIGPVYSIAPWNAPIILGNRAIAAPLAAGCSVILKSSEKSPRVSYLLVKCYLEAGVPPKAIQLIHFAPQNNVKATELIVSDNHIRKVNFTGSTLVGQKIAAVCAKYLKPYLLELGGKNYSIVCADADLKKAVDSSIFSAFTHKGQICMCVDKVYVHESVYDKFLELLLAAIRKASKSPDHQIPQRDLTITTRVYDLVTEALSKGAILAFGKAPTAATCYDHSPLQPMVLTDVNSDMGIHTQETFGPVFAVYKYQDEVLTIRSLNEGEYGLKASIWSQNVMQALSFAKMIDSGGVHINNSTIHDEACTPHGGVKSSGTGRFNSTWGIDEFSYVKTITINQ